MCQHKFMFISLLFQLWICQGVIDRDLRLTPKKSLQHFGRTLYYDPNKNYTDGNIPWEESLKHVTFFTLFPQVENNSSQSDLEEYTEFMHSEYTRNAEEYPKFGDIVTLASGWLEKSNGHHFVEGVCVKHCIANALALWRVQRIRHRDSQRGFRYEIKISVTPINSKAASQNSNLFTEQYSKSFILKDDDYPKSFTRKSDNLAYDRQGRIINESPRNKDDIVSHLSPLNIGEYFKEIPKASSKIGYDASTKTVFPTTYRPNLLVKFPKPENYDASEGLKTLVTHHFHHHYFMKDADQSIHRDQPLFHSKTDSIQIIDGSKAEFMQPQYTINVHPPPITTTAVPSPPTVFYMQQIPLYKHSLPLEEKMSQRVDSKPFKKSEQQFEEIHYSDPDPLYKNLDSFGGSFETALAGMHLQVERPITQFSHVPDSVEHKLPDQKGQNTRVSYMNNAETEHLTTILTPYISSRIPFLPTYKFDSDRSLKNVINTRIRTYSYGTTQQPVIKWKPRRKLNDRITEKNTIENANAQKDLITVTPSKLGYDDVEVFTHKSVSKSVSVKVGNRTQEYPLS